MKPSKPSPDFPLFPHSCGSWAKKIKGKLYYFGPWANPSAALENYRGRFVTKATVPTPATTPNVLRQNSQIKPDRPEGFPLFAHANGQWAKKVLGVMYYFGPWDEPQAALDRWLADKDALLHGRRPSSKGGLTIDGLVNHFLENRAARVLTRELQPRTFEDYKTVAERIIEVFGRTCIVADLQPSDFERLRNEFATTHGPVALLSDITRAKTIFNYGKIQFQTTVDYGASFSPPTRNVLRAAKNSGPVKFFTAVEIRKLLAGASETLKAMILLGINCAFGNHDCAMIEHQHLDLHDGWHRYPRSKTGIVRRCPLWPETLEALTAAKKIRPAHRHDHLESRFFVTAKGNSWENPGKDGPITKQFGKLMRNVKQHQVGRGFYSLRHTFQTVGDASGQTVAVQYVMGHAPASDDMAAIYRAKTFEANLISLSDHVRTWLYT